VGKAGIATEDLSDHSEELFVEGQWEGGRTGVFPWSQCCISITVS
jgi:hypothetical protein